MNGQTWQRILTSAAVALVVSASGALAYEKLVDDPGCCKAGAACCRTDAPCCHHHAKDSEAPR